MDGASKIEIHNSVVRFLENGRWRAPAQFDGDREGYAAFCNEIVEDIHAEKFSPEAIHAGMTIFRREWKPERWPSTADLLDFIRKGAARTQPRVEQKPGEQWTGEKWADRMMYSQAGQRAIADGCPYEFWFWCKQNPGKTPQEDDERQFRENERIGRARLKDLREHPENYPTDHAKWLAMGEKFRRENDRLACQYSRERAA